MKTPIIAELLKYKQGKSISFHTPGHKNGSFYLKDLENLWQDDFLASDLTEVPGLDNLQMPTGCIRESEELTAELFGAKRSFYLVNGTSAGIMASILSLAYQKQVFVPRHVHKSVYNGLTLAESEIISLPIASDPSLELALGLEPEVFLEYIRKYPDCKVLVLSNPNYQGVAYKLQELMEIARDEKIAVIVDEAHGSHFAFSDALPKTALDLGAKILIQSWHKSLPVLTQASVLHTSDESLVESLQKFLNLLQTTSPSYLLLASLDASQNYLRTEAKKDLQESWQKLEGLREFIRGLKNISLELEDYEKDFLKINLSSKKISGFDLEEILRQDYGLYAEMAEEKYLLLMFALRVDNRILLKLKHSLSEIDVFLDKKEELPARKRENKFSLAKRRLSLKEACFREKELISSSLALGKISGDFLIKYPPGIPLLTPGEEIDQEILEIILEDFPEKREISIIKERREESAGQVYKL